LPHSRLHCAMAADAERDEVAWIVSAPVREGQDMVNLLGLSTTA